MSPSGRYMPQCAGCDCELPVGSYRYVVRAILQAHNKGQGKTICWLCGPCWKQIRRALKLAKGG